MPKFLVLIAASLLLTNHTICQPAKESFFQLIYLSNDISYSAAKLSDEIKKVKSLDTVKAIVRNRITENKGYIVISYLKNGVYYRWQRRMGQVPEESTEKWDIFGTRGGDLTVITRPEQFSRFFYDTLIIIDTLNLRVTDRSRSGMEQAYSIWYNCGDTTLEESVPVWDFNKLQFTASLLNRCEGRAAYMRLFHISQPSVALASCTLFFPEPELKQEWLAIAKGLKKSRPSLITSEVAGYLYSYIHKKYGRCVFEELNTWLAKSL